jgi:hypothetical protein
VDPDTGAVVVTIRAFTVALVGAVAAVYVSEVNDPVVSPGAKRSISSMT